MAMNKKEIEHLRELMREVRLAKAFRFTEEVKPDVPPPQMFSELAKGWLFCTYLSDPRVMRACSNSVNHSSGSDEKTSSQGSRALYSTKLLALKGLRHEVELKCAEILEKIDSQIEDEQAGIRKEKS